MLQSEPLTPEKEQYLVNSQCGSCDNKPLVGKKKSFLVNINNNNSVYIFQNRFVVPLKNLTAHPYCPESSLAVQVHPNALWAVL
jgi:hypothetical protein